MHVVKQPNTDDMLNVSLSLLKQTLSNKSIYYKGIAIGRFNGDYYLNDPKNNRCVLYHSVESLVFDLTNL